MNKAFIVLLFLSLLIFSGCSLKTNESIGKNSNPVLNVAIDSVDLKIKEAQDKYLIAKTKEIEIATQIYATENPNFPIINDFNGAPTTTKIYKGSENWNKLRNIILSSPANKGFSLDINDIANINRPIEYFSDGNVYTFRTYLNFNKNYNIAGKDFKCQTKEGDLCILTINSKSE